MAGEGDTITVAGSTPPGEGAQTVQEALDCTRLALSRFEHGEQTRNLSRTAQSIALGEAYLRAKELHATECNDMEKHERKKGWSDIVLREFPQTGEAALKAHATLAKLAHDFYFLRFVPIPPSRFRGEHKNLRAAISLMKDPVQHSNWSMESVIFWHAN